MSTTNYISRFSKTFNKDESDNVLQSRYLYRMYFDIIIINLKIEYTCIYIYF